MSFLLPCPLCGPRDVYEFRYGGEIQKRPAPGSPPEIWAAYLYERTNIDGVERAWWFHWNGCRRWFQVERDTRDNRVLQSAWTLAAAAATTGPGGATSTTAGPPPATAGAPESDGAVSG
jgi:sarcosine oxidase, subunit delta